MAVLEVRNLRKFYGELEVISDISFDVSKGEVVSVIGPSGSGKSTMLRCINQLEKVTSGTICVCGDEMITGEKNGEAVYASHDVLKRIRRNVGLVFQNFNLFPHFSVLRNITEAPVSVMKVSKEEAEAKAMELP